MKIRIGNGFDFHRIEEGNGMMLAGIFIECPFRVIAHSDGDIILHTVVDSILGGLAVGDIGILFPDTNPKWKGANSVIFLNEALSIMKEKSFTISNLDVTIICEKPKITPIRKQLTNNLLNLIQLQGVEITNEDICIKATTTEKMGFTGRGEGIACFATVCLVQGS